VQLSLQAPHFGMISRIRRLQTAAALHQLIKRQSVFVYVSNEISAAHFARPRGRGLVRLLRQVSS
jgi:hypothetical protein